MVTEQEQANIIKKHFQDMLAPNNASLTKEYIPRQMTRPFTTEEITKAVKKMKNGKSAGVDNLNSEYIKYAPEIIHSEIASIFNEMAQTGNYPDEINLGVLTPLQKPGKKRGPCENLRPIILLSTLRKILTICMIDRLWEKISKNITKDQAAYQPGRSTTEQVFALKMMCEKVITSNNYIQLIYYY